MILKLVARVQCLIADDDGQALVEYGLILGLIAVVCLVALTAIGLAVSGALDSFAGAFGGGGGSSTTPVASPVP